MSSRSWLKTALENRRSLDLPTKERGNSLDNLHVEGKPRKDLVPHKNVAGIRMVNPTNPSGPNPPRLNDCSSLHWSKSAIQVKNTYTGMRNVLSSPITRTSNLPVVIMVECYTRKRKEDRYLEINGCHGSKRIIHT